VPTNSAVHSRPVHSLLLVRNGVDHDARVLRAARVAQRTFGGGVLVVGVATASAPAGKTSVEGVPVLRLPALPPSLGALARLLAQSGRALRAPNDRRVHEPQRTEVPESTSEALQRAPFGPHPPSGVPSGALPLTLAARVRRTLSGLSFALQALLAAQRAKPRLVQANDWNTMWAGLLVKALCGSRLVYDSHELWADRNGRWEWRGWLLVCEALFVRAADEVITSSPGYADALAARYRVRRPSVVRNIPERHSTAGSLAQDRMGPNPEAPNSAPCAPHPETSGPPSPPRVVYIGGLMPGRGLEQMIDALPLLPDICLRTIGPGAPRYRAGLISRATAAGVADRVELHAPVAPGEVQGVLAGAAAGLCLIQPICRSYELSLPNKLFEYAAAGVPVLASDVPVISAVVRDKGLGEIAASEQPTAIAEGVRRLLAPVRWREATEHAREFSATCNWVSEAPALAGAYLRALRH
jgi:glycosyltransferase involved in cell wall biosynthesis